jgi:hypothetical protein
MGLVPEVFIKLVLDLTEELRHRLVSALPLAGLAVTEPEDLTFDARRHMLRCGFNLKNLAAGVFQFFSFNVVEAFGSEFVQGLSHFGVF